ncbi:type VI secretion protein VasK [Pseudomonas sp. P2652]|nr:ImcF-related family protein [Pseudomonas petrae]MCF7536034.1 type VI secretion protein VasK [Pseudomonas petrae]MCF7557584.1 type VI secretion protein VasK [Pseudomonas petrae]
MKYLIGNGWRRAGGAVWLVAFAAALGWLVYTYGVRVGLTERHQQITAFLLLMVIALLVQTLPRALALMKSRLSVERRQGDGVFPPEESSSTPDTKKLPGVAELQEHLDHQYTAFQRTRTRFLLVVGEPEQIEAIAPGLADAQWLEGQNTVLLWGGSPQSQLAEAATRWHAVTQRRGLDGVVWALDKQQSANAATMASGVAGLQQLARTLGWQLPLHLWEVCESEWTQQKRARGPAGLLLPPRLDGLQLETMLAPIHYPLHQMGLAELTVHPDHDFLSRLSSNLKAEGIARWRQALMPLLGKFARGVPLRGLWFSLPALSTESVGNLWLPGPAWAGVLTEKSRQTRRLGWPVTRVSYALALGAMLIWLTGLALSFSTHRAQILDIQSSLVAVEPSGNGDAPLLALNALILEMDRLKDRARRGEPWYQRFGLSQNDALLAVMWPRYVEANDRLMRDPAAENLKRQLAALVASPADSPRRAKGAHNAYVQLKAYLMMARPEKVDAAFLVTALGHAEPTRMGVSPGLWKGLSPTLWQFYAEQLAANPQWRIEADNALVAQARRVLLVQLGQRNGEASLYQQVLEAAATHSPDLGVEQMVDDKEAWPLFFTEARVPGVFTRQAWEGQVRQAIDDIVEARREQIDWVLSDRESSGVADTSPEQLRARLTERYFHDYSGAWLEFLNSVQWRRADSLADVIDQLTLMSDIRQSPLIAFMNTLAWQGQAGNRSQGLKDSLVQSAQKLMGSERPARVPAISQQFDTPAGPLDPTFGPLLGLLGKDPEGKGGDDDLSLQAFLTRVTRVRLKLQQVSHAADPQGMTQAMAQTVFQGKNIDLTDTRAYGELLAASLGEEWDGVAHALFVQPLDQAWGKVLDPSAAALNRQWQQAVVDHWDTAFLGRYPFAATGSDASLTMLGKMIRADSGRIEQFLQRELTGVLRKDGGRWGVDPTHGQGLMINPRFLAAVNQLSHLADVLYTDGGMGINFELQGKAVRDVVQTTFVLNGARHQYFNQKESWQRFSWPGTTDYPGASLTWTSVRSGERLYGDFQGAWGLIRLLDTATVTALDDSDSRYRISVPAPDGLDLTWHMRTELGAGPMSLLALRNFRLPRQIFLNGIASAQTSSRAEVIE